GIHLVKKEDDFKPSANHTSLFIFVHDVDALYDEYQKSGANITNPIADRDYGMRDFDVTDPNGYILAFGQGIEQ
ncbi:MAG: VOC family protein, partial [Bacteroidota bacterium]